MDLQVIKISKDKKRTMPKFNKNLGFGKHFSDHMFLMEYTDGKWGKARIEPYDNISLPPSAMVFHYGQGIFEGLKAYKNNDDDVFLFRPEMNLKRMNKSATRLVMPTFDEKFVLKALIELLKLDKNWIPSEKGQSLYIRPTMVACEPFLGVRPSDNYLFFIIIGPVASYYANGIEPVDIFVTEKYVRAVQGGVGDVKAMGNYASSMLAQMEGKKLGCAQVLWLDGLNRKYIEEVGAMNIFIRFDNELVTPSLSGSILPGVTRDSVLKITKDWGLNVNERQIELQEVLEGLKSGKVQEVFGVGTAAVISPVGKLLYKKESYQVGNGKIGELSLKLYEFLTELQSGRVRDPFNFRLKI